LMVKSAMTYFPIVLYWAKMNPKHIAEMLSQMNSQVVKERTFELISLPVKTELNRGTRCHLISRSLLSLYSTSGVLSVPGAMNRLSAPFGIALDRERPFMSHFSLRTPPFTRGGVEPSCSTWAMKSLLRVGINSSQSI
jgi:hypothetical protein